MTCKRGHSFRGDENYRARRGWCPICFKEVQKRYRKSDKAKHQRKRYRESALGQETRRRNNARTNPARIRAGNTYLGYCGFSVNDTEAMLNGSSD